MERGTGEYGREHFNRGHRLETLVMAGFDSPEAFVRFVAENFEYALPNEGGRHGLIAMKPEWANVLVVELVENNGYCTVVTGWAQRPGKNYRGEKPWVESPTLTRDLGDPARLHVRPAEAPQGESVQGPDGQDSIPKTTLPPPSPQYCSAWK